ncbi:hypothetical protein N7516_007134 [Penicillium verrucosum]|uniref:uncharacterized protein n=1 Tax=Penicillium verrucosum TaxID=60171 RepID=UPI0025455FE3|nr:uncharacterized protein N7516_007134 [Penicillium verrucosum]KAJ5932645.1 hypothetical protein N7516_007134 [Penicillium verrucosum]
MVFLDDSRADKPLCIVPQLRILVAPLVVVPCEELRQAVCEAACIFTADREREKERMRGDEFMQAQFRRTLQVPCFLTTEG